MNKLGAHSTWIVAAGVLLYIGGCTSVEQKWQTAAQINNIQAYEEFLEELPSSDSYYIYRERAKGRIATTVRRIRIAQIEVSSRLREIGDKEVSHVKLELHRILSEELGKAGYEVVTNEEHAEINLSYHETFAVSFGGLTVGGTNSPATSTQSTSKSNRIDLQAKLISKKYGELAKRDAYVKVADILAPNVSPVQLYKDMLRSRIKGFLPLTRISDVVYDK